MAASRRLSFNHGKDAMKIVIKGTPKEIVAYARHMQKRLTKKAANSITRPEGITLTLDEANHDNQTACEAKM